MPHRDQPYRLRYRTVWISDVHLGCRGCRADFLLEFLHAVEYIERFEQALAAEAARRRLDGVICGHIHRPRVRSIEGVAYFNTGDWMESCTALAEDPEGRLELIHWAGTPALQTRPAVAA
ncbi:MAG TPA: hypothetical protein VFA86_06280 [Gammaproteobacteria bacterium]|nr:hypothetical protein [Gammaproteobacteria bacterium]